MPKIAVCIPVLGDTRAGFTLSLAAMLAHSYEAMGDALRIRTFMATTSVLALNRDNLVTSARDWGAEWILWLDADQTFPPDALVRLLSAGEPVIGANYPRRHIEAEPTAGRFVEGKEELVWTTADKARQGLVEPVDYMGFGVCLVSIEAVEAAAPPLFTGEEDGEDVIFFRKLAAAGYPPKVDHRLSSEVGHIDLQLLTFRHSINRRNMREMNAQLAAAKREKKAGPAG